MAEKILKTRIQLLKNTDSYFAEHNPLTLDGELYIVEVNGVTKLKIGNGERYNDIPFYEDNLLPNLGFDISDAADGQILMYNEVTDKWENVDLADDKSIVYLEGNELTIQGYEEAHHGQMLVKDISSEGEGVVWIDPLSPAALNYAVAEAERHAGDASTAAINAANSAVDAERSATNAATINQRTREYVDDKFWWGTIEEYNALSEIKEGTFYHIMV